MGVRIWIDDQHHLPILLAGLAQVGLIGTIGVLAGVAPTVWLPMAFLAACGLAFLAGIAANRAQRQGNAMAAVVRARHALSALVAAGLTLSITILGA
ncbi:MAG: hypothetical protein EAZ99_18885 [Alphaproteobacteria bacterium]|nr:hypothetical protein [Alphaproteobacteria bacterium]TAD87071.1 MAG: hypothetical protein EAZ99_18885 [Alphaproteobacteria bacterium]